jgi:YidC/Oxa1 family membrane protein insertase
VDRNVVTATILIGLIMMVWLFWLAPQDRPQPATDPATSEQQTAPQSAELQAVPEEVRRTGPTIGEPSQLRPVTDSLFAAAQSGEERLITVENELYRAVFSTKGATLRSFEMLKFNRPDRTTPVQLVDTTQPGAIALQFTSPASHRVDTRTLFFTSNAPEFVRVDREDVSIEFTTAIGNGSIVQTYTFDPDTYQVDLDIRQTNPETFSTMDGYELVWDGRVPFSEDNPKVESQSAGVYARSGGEVEKVVLTRDENGSKTLSGAVDWIGIKSQYFAAIVMPDQETRGAEIFGARAGEPGEIGYNIHFEGLLDMGYPGVEPQHFRLYIGPMDYFSLASYKLRLYDMVDYGWKWIQWMIRPLAKFVFIPLFRFMHNVIPSYGIVIILLALLMKIVLYPLTKKSFRSMAKMRDLQPRMEAIKEKYADNPQKQQEAMMKMYKEEGANPLGGCMPMLLQYPVIIALWRFLPQSIEIRQQGFLWASDLSAPDKILQLPFDIPFYGDFVAGFTLLMGLSMIVQMKVQMASTPSNPQMKMFTYLMPVMIFAIFNRFAAGLSLYYLCYNVFTAVQQKWINMGLEKEKAAKEAEAAARPAYATVSTNGSPKSGKKKKAKK